MIKMRGEMEVETNKISPYSEQIVTLDYSYRNNSKDEETAHRTKIFSR